MKARLQLVLGVLAAFVLSFPAPARASIQLHSSPCALDAGGQLASRTDFNNKTTTFSYDVMGRLLQKVPDASFGTNSIITFTYTVSGQRATMTDASGSTTYAYDANRDWLVGKTQVIGSLTTTLHYTNDVAGNVVALKSSTANGTLVYYQWDALNRLAGVSGPMVGQTTYSYNGPGSLAGKMDFNNCGMKPARSWRICSMRKSSSPSQFSIGSDLIDPAAASGARASPRFDVIPPCGVAAA